MDRVYYEIEWNGQSKSVYSEQELIWWQNELVHACGADEYMVKTIVNGKCTEQIKVRA